MRTIVCKDGEATLEICRRCYTGCPYCYLQGNCSSRGEIIPFRLIVSRIDWIKEHTNVKVIWLVGGEPLVHPDFKAICDYVIALGFELNIVTSGNISNRSYEIENRKYLLYLYEKGKLSLDVSYHGPRNHDKFKWLFDELKLRFKDHREARKKLGRYHENEYDLGSTAVIDFGYEASREELTNYINKICSIVNWINQTPEQMDVIYPLYLEHLKQTDKARLNYGIWSLDGDQGFRVRVVLAGPTTITYTHGDAHIVRPGGGVCPAIGSEAFEDHIVTDEIMITANGSLVFPRAECIDMRFPFLNVDLHKTHNEIFNTFSKSLEAVHKMVFAFNRKKAVDNCDQDGKEKECTSCPFLSMCDACWKLPKF